MTRWFCSKYFQFSLTFNLYQWMLGNINWGITVILILNYCFNFSPHSYPPQAMLWFMLKTACLVQSHLVSLLFRSEDLSRPKEQGEREKGKTDWSWKVFVFIKNEGEITNLPPVCSHSVLFFPHKYSTLTLSLFYSVGRDFSLGSWWRVSGEDVSSFHLLQRTKGSLTTYILFL